MTCQDQKLYLTLIDWLSAKSSLSDMSRPFNITTDWGIPLSNGEILKVYTVGVPKVQDCKPFKKKDKYFDRR